MGTLMKLNIQLTAVDNVQAQYLNLRPRPFLKWLGYFLGAIIALVWVLSIKVAVAHPETISTPLWMLAPFIYFWLMFGVWLPWRSRKTFAQQKVLQQPYSFELTEELFFATAAYGETRLTWDYFRKWKEGKTLFIVYQSDRIMQIIPKRCFASAEEMVEFRALLTKKIGTAKK